MGGERDLFVELTDGTDIFSSVSLISGGGLLRLASDTTVTGNAKIVWDGQDGNATGVNPTGLGGARFHQLQRQHDDRHPAGRRRRPSELRGEAASVHRRRQVVGVHDDGAGDARRRRDQAGDVQLRRHRRRNSAGGGVDFTNVGAVELTFVGVSAVDGQVSLVGLIGLTTKTADFTAYNRLSLGDRVWNDADNDGQLDAGEQGIGGVKLNLYNDVDDNNQYTPGVDTFVAHDDHRRHGQLPVHRPAARQLRRAGRRGELQRRAGARPG